MNCFNIQAHDLCLNKQQQQQQNRELDTSIHIFFLCYSEI